MIESYILFTCILDPKFVSNELMCVNLAHLMSFWCCLVLVGFSNMHPGFFTMIFFLVAALISIILVCHLLLLLMRSLWPLLLSWGLISEYRIKMGYNLGIRFVI